MSSLQDGVSWAQTLPVELLTAIFAQLDPEHRARQL